MTGSKKHIAIAARVITGQTGTSRTVLDHARYLSELGHRVTLLGEKFDRDKAKASGAEIVRILPVKLGSKTKRKIFSAQVAWQSRARKVDLVWGHGDNLEQDVLSLHNCVHYAHEVIHGRPLPESSGVGMMHSRMLQAQSFKKLIANSQLMARDVVERFGVSSEKIEVVYPGYNPKQFNQTNRDANRSMVRGSLEIPEDSTVLGLITSGDFKKRGVEEFIDALAQLPTDLREKIHVLIVGKNDRVSELRQSTEQSGLAGHIRFLPPTPNIEEVYHALDLLVHPAKIEEFGQVVQESVVCGTPVLAGPLVGSTEFFIGPAKELVLPGVSAAEIAAGIEKCLSQPDLLATGQTVALEKMQANTDQENFERSMVAIGLSM